MTNNDHKITSLTIENGAYTIPVFDSEGEESGRLKINPSDWNLGKRFDKCVEELEKLEIKDNISMEEFYELTDKIEKIFDFLLGYSSKELFAKCNPLTFTSDGDTYCEKLFEGIGSIIETETEYRVAKKAAKIKKGIKKYS